MIKLTLPFFKKIALFSNWAKNVNIELKIIFVQNEHDSQSMRMLLANLFTDVKAFPISFIILIEREVLSLTPSNKHFIPIAIFHIHLMKYRLCSANQRR